MAVFVLAGLCLTGASCAAPGRGRAEVVTLRMRIDGRSLVTHDSDGMAHARVAYSNTTLSWRARGDTLWVCSQEFPDVDAKPEMADEYAVSIDGIDYPLFHPPEQARCVALARGLTHGVHTVSLTKRTEASVGETVFSRPPDALPNPPPAKTRHLVAIGDSITCGYGVLTSDPHHHFEPSLEDGTRSFVALASRAVAASVTTVAYSGRGVWRNRDGATDDTLVDLWPRALPFSELPPRWPDKADAVVIHLGTNDAHPDGMDFVAFERAYRRLLKMVDADSPGALVVLAAGPMVSNKASLTKQAGLHDSMVALLSSMAQQRSQSGRRTVVLALPPQDEPPYQALGWGGDYHPALATQADMASRLEDVLRRELQW